MKRIATATIALVTAFALLLPGGALAASKTYRQTGQVVGDKGSKVKLRVKVKSGEPQQIKGFKAKDVITRCGPKKRTKVERYDYSSESPIPVVGGDFDITLRDQSIGLKMVIRGEVNRHGKAVVGKIKTNRFDDGKRACKAPKQKFKTSI